METIGTLINNLKTKFNEQATNETLLKIANEIVSELEHKLGKTSKKGNVLIPTLTYQNRVPATNSKAEIKESPETKSLNDILKEEKTEISDVLKNAPVHDLRKAIGINDRFVFISELFDGKEILYEQSIKTLNQINDLKEAENWMETELKIKLNWSDEADAVQQFYKLVKRKYS